MSKVRYHVEHLKDGEWLPVINLDTKKIVFRYREDTAAKLFKEITNRYNGEFRLVQNGETTCFDEAMNKHIELMKERGEHV